jgi:TonB family protein
MRRSTPLVLATIETGVLLAGLAAAQQPPRFTGEHELGLLAYKEPVVPKLAVDGSAVVAFTIRANGRVGDALTLSAIDRVLAASARDAVLEWRFDRDPALGRGREALPTLVLRRQIVEFVFKRDGVVRSLSHFDSAKAGFPVDQTSPIRLVRSADLEKPLVRILAPASAEVDKLLAAITESGVVIVSFVVDETGAVRVPVAERTESPALIAAALALVGGWRFEPPTHGGRPVLVVERNTLTFRPRAN